MQKGLHLEGWFTEQLFQDGVKQQLPINKTITRTTSPYNNEMILFQSTPVGTVLTLDGAVQLTTLDSHHYSESFVHPAVVSWLAHRLMKENQNMSDHHMIEERIKLALSELHVLVIGGGDGDVAGEVLQYPGAKVTIVEIDALVVEVCKAHLPDIAHGAFDDPRATWVIGDGIQFVHELQYRGQYSIVLVDSSDPVGPAEKLFTKEFYEACKTCLKPDGIALHQSGSIYYQREEVISAYKEMCEIYDGKPWLLMPQVPTYPGGSITLIGGSDRLAQNIPDAVIANLWHILTERFKIKTRYYSRAMHRALQVVPCDLENELALCHPEVASYGEIE